jgi:outer membrane protein OmpA-like peptidoglycan-associated protein/tetratricopeptide (TPR) repeat protein
MKNYLALVLLVISTSFTAMAQSKKALKYFNKARVEVRENNVESALDNLDKALKDTPGYLEALLFKADLLKQLGRADETIPLYEKAIAGGAPYYVYLFFGEALFDSKEYSRSIEALKKYAESPQATRKYLDKANELISNSEFALKATQEAKPYNPQNLGSKVNSHKMEYFPSISADGLTLVFTHRDPHSEDRGDEDFWFTTRDSVNAPWKIAAPVGGQLNTRLNEGAQSISASGNVIFFAACERPEGMGSCDIYASFLQGNNTYSKPFNLGPNVNSAMWESQPSISSDGKTLYFVRGAGSTARNIEIMYSTLNEKGQWTEAKKVEGSINTGGQDVSPFIHFDNQSLYFASNGHPGMGELDFFVSRRQPDGTWGEPQNLGYPINTAGSEFSLIVAPDGKTGFFASDNIEGGMGLLDLYSFELPEEARALEIAYIRGKVINKKTKEPVSAEIIFNDLDKNLAVLTDNSGRDGNYFSVLPGNSDYGLSIQKKGFLFYSKNFSLSNQSAEKAYVLNVELIPIEVGEKVKLENIFFGFDSFELEDRSSAELNTIISFLKENPGVKISIEGHTDNEGSSAYNKSLSENRAKSVFIYLTENGIDKGRLSYKGFGDSMPVSTNDTEEGRALNRRTEVKITSIAPQ